MTADSTQAATITETTKAGAWGTITSTREGEPPRSFVTVTRRRTYEVPHGYAAVVDLAYPGDDEDPYGTAGPSCFVAYTVPVNPETLTTSGDGLPCVRIAHLYYLPVESLVRIETWHDADDLSQPALWTTEEEARAHVKTVRHLLTQRGLRDDTTDDSAPDQEEAPEGP